MSQRLNLPAINGRTVPIRAALNKSSAMLSKIEEHTAHGRLDGHHADAEQYLQQAGQQTEQRERDAAPEAKQNGNYKHKKSGC